MFILLLKKYRRNLIISFLHNGNLILKTDINRIVLYFVFCFVFVVFQIMEANSKNMFYCSC